MLYPVDPSVIANPIRGVSQMVTPVVNPLRCHFIAQVFFQLMLGCSVCPEEHLNKYESLPNLSFEHCRVIQTHAYKYISIL